MKPLSHDVDLDEEAAAIAEFIRAKWTPIENLDAIVVAARDAAMHAARAWVDQHHVWRVANDLEDQREAQLKLALGEELASDAVMYDACAHVLKQISYRAGDLREAALAIDGRWDYERRVNAVAGALSSRFPGLSGARPLGWDELAQDYIDFDGQEAYDPKPDLEIFKGSRCEGTLSGSFPGRVALPYVMYDEKCQGRRAYCVLVGAIYAQFLTIAEHRNNHRLGLAIQDMVAPQLKLPGMTFDQPQPPNDPLLRFMMDEIRPAPTAAAWESVMRRKEAAKDQKPLTPEQQAQAEANQRAASARLIEEMVADLKRREAGLSPMASYEQHQREHEAKGAKLRALVDAPVPAEPGEAQSAPGDQAAVSEDEAQRHAVDRPRA